MLIIYNDLVVNLNNVSDFCLFREKIIFYFTFLDKFDEPNEIYFTYTNKETAKKAFDKIIYAYAHEYRTLDLSEYAAD